MMYPFIKRVTILTLLITIQVREHHMSNRLYDHLYFRILHLHKPIGLSTRQVNHRCNSEACSIFFDPQKAFDSVPQHSLIAKLSLLTSVLTQMDNRLTDRINVLESKPLPSHSYPVISGVPQGLFIIYIDGLGDVLSISSMSMYADDLLLYRPVHSHSDYQALQADIADSLKCCKKTLLF